MTGKTSLKQSIFVVDAASAATSQLVEALSDNHYDVRVIEESQAAFTLALAEPPLLIMSEVMQERIDGVDLFKKLRANPATQEIAFLFVTRQTDLEARLKLLALEIDDFIAKPYYPEEVVARVESILQESAGSRASQSLLTQGFAGSLDEMNLMDLIQTLELGKKSAIIHLVREPDDGFVYVDGGEVVDAVHHDLPAAAALDNLMMWLHGYFELAMQPVQRQRQIFQSNRELLVSGSQRLHEYKERAGQLPAMDSFVTRDAEVQNPELSEMESRIWAMLERPQPIRLLVSSSQDDELRTLEVIQALWERNCIKVFPGAATDTDLIARDILLRVSEARQIGADPYSRIASFFVRKGSQKKKTLLNPENFGDRRAASGIVTHKIYLQRADLMLIRQKLLAHRP
jgi:CheY-like chemotaxis protein